MKFVPPPDYDAQIQLEPKDVAQGVAMNVGYGKDGASAQLSAEGAPMCLDRDVVRRTVMKGLPIVMVKTLLDGYRVTCGQDKQRKAFPFDAFGEVMEAAFKQYPVGRYVNKGYRDSYVEFAAHPLCDQQLMILYHNLLVDMCQVSARKFTTVIANNASEQGRADNQATPSEHACK